MEESLALFATHLGIGIAEDEADGGEEVTLARTISADNNIGARRERLENGLVLIAALVLARARAQDGAKRGMARVAHLLKPWMIICLIYIATTGAASRRQVQRRIQMNARRGKGKNRRGKSAACNEYGIRCRDRNHLTEAGLSRLQG